MLGRLFTDHPRSAGETYLRHLESASSFGLRMILAGLACTIHGVFPFLFVRTGSSAIRALHNDMLDNRRRTEITAEPELGAYI
jgi:hypothetical protein